ncbi:unannotated protein [freshwater metagenome]|uniref:Unannotated protein n=1 Tax=freshwater metagenome TaxID=449393 RepID=A0A6J6DTX0_9ZZZZ
MQVAVDELVHAVVESRTEKHALAVGRCRIQNARDNRQEAEVGHVVGLVENGDLNRVEKEQLLLHEVFESTGRRDDDVHAFFQGGDLTVLRDATKDDRGLQLVGRSQRLESRVNLRRELASRRKNQSDGMPRATTTARQGCSQSCRHRDAERKRLARTGLSTTENVSPGQGVRKGVDLNGERSINARLLENRDERSWHTKCAKWVCRQRGIPSMCFPCAPS